MKKAWTCLTIGVAFSIMWSASSARAGVLKIWMDEFKPDYIPLHGQTTSQLTIQDPSSAKVVQWFDSKTFWVGWVPVKLPAASTIQKVVYYHGGGGVSIGCSLNRVKFGQQEEMIATANALPATAQLVQLDVPDAGKLVITAGYRYYVRVVMPLGAVVRGVKIYY